VFRMFLRGKRALPTDDEGAPLHRTNEKAGFAPGLPLINAARAYLAEDTLRPVTIGEATASLAA